MLTAHNIVAGYDRRRPVINGIDLEIPPGKTIGLAGPSGSGKSTLARVVSLLHQPFSGSVTIDGEAVTGYRHLAAREQRIRIGVLFQQPRLSVDPRMTLKQAITEPLRANRLPLETIPELAELVALTPDLLERHAHEVSDGQLQRACLARALALQPPYLICDEMTTMLDASTTAALIAVIRDYQHQTGAGVLAISHDRKLLGRWTDHTVHLR